MKRRNKLFAILSLSLLLGGCSIFGAGCKSTPEQTSAEQSQNTGSNGAEENIKQQLSKIHEEENVPLKEYTILDTVSDHKIKYILVYADYDEDGKEELGRDRLFLFQTEGKNAQMICDAEMSISNGFSCEMVETDDGTMLFGDLKDKTYDGSIDEMVDVEYTSAVVSVDGKEVAQKNVSGKAGYLIHLSEKTVQDIEIQFFNKNSEVVGTASSDKDAEYPIMKYDINVETGYERNVAELAEKYGIAYESTELLEEEQIEAIPRGENEIVKFKTVDKIAGTISNGSDYSVSPHIAVEVCYLYDTEQQKATSIQYIGDRILYIPEGTNYSIESGEFNICDNRISVTASIECPVSAKKVSVGGDILEIINTADGYSAQSKAKTFVTDIVLSDLS